MACTHELYQADRFGNVVNHSNASSFRKVEEATSFKKRSRMYHHKTLITVHRIARIFRGLKFSRIGRFWIFAVSIFAVASAPRLRPLFASTV